MAMRSSPALARGAHRPMFVGVVDPNVGTTRRGFFVDCHYILGIEEDSWVSHPSSLSSTVQGLAGPLPGVADARLSAPSTSTEVQWERGGLGSLRPFFLLNAEEGLNTFGSPRPPKVP